MTISTIEKNTISSRFKKSWIDLEASSPQPSNLRSLLCVDARELLQEIENGQQSFIDEFTASLYAGDFYLLKNAFDKKFLSNVSERVFNFANSEPSSFHKMLEGTPDFHRIIDDGITLDYSLRALRHGFYFYRFNKDPAFVYRDFSPVWRTVKKISGLDPLAFENNTPKDGVIDRIVVYLYPYGGGNLRAHVDPTNNHKTTTGIMMSTRGKDYEQGGFYCIGSNSNPVDIEPYIETGDMFIFYPTLVHGVKPVDAHRDLDWSEPKGRWFLGVSSVDSDHIIERKTGFHLGYEY